MPPLRGLLGSLFSAALVVPVAACGHRETESPHADQAVGPASTDPVAVQRGQRLVSVRCERGCGGAQVELSRLQRACVRDPSSNVHHVSERPAMIEMGCCVESEGVFREACGDEGSMGGCVARWSRYCERGTLLESDEPGEALEGGPT